MSVRRAAKVFRRFQGAKTTSIWPDEKKVRVRVPDRLIQMGQAILVWYLSDKVLDDADGSELEAYEHEFESEDVQLYYDAKIMSPRGAPVYDLHAPKDWTVLGVCEGWAFRMADGTAKEIRVDGTLLLWDESSKTLGMLHMDEKVLLGIIRGGKLRLTRYGIEG